ncbi:hypothetical protein [Streptomyces sp. NPDC003032]
MKSRTVTYRKFMGPWGLLVNLTACVSHGERPDPADQAVSDRLYLRVLDRFADDEDVKFLMLGLRLMAQPVLAACDEDTIGIHVQELDYLPTDYQPEAAALAMMTWIGAEFGVEIPQIDIEFDRATGYSVSWPEDL